MTPESEFDSINFDSFSTGFSYATNLNHNLDAATTVERNKNYDFFSLSTNSVLFDKYVKFSTYLSSRELRGFGSELSFVDPDQSALFKEHLFIVEHNNINLTPFDSFAQTTFSYSNQFLVNFWGVNIQIQNLLGLNTTSRKYGYAESLSIIKKNNKYAHNLSMSISAFFIMNLPFEILNMFFLK